MFVMFLQQDSKIFDYWILLYAKIHSVKKIDYSYAKFIYLLLVKKILPDFDVLYLCQGLLKMKFCNRWPSLVEVSFFHS